MKPTQKTSWKKVGENLIRIGETYYVRTKVGGKLVVKSLKTKRLDIAKLRRNDEMAKLTLRVATPTAPETDAALHKLVAEYSATLDRPELKRSTLHYYRQNLLALLKLPDVRPAKVTRDMARKWFTGVCSTLQPKRANAVLGMARWFFAWCQERRLCADDPTEPLKKLPVSRKILKLPSPVEFFAIVESIRSQGGRFSHEAANMVEFMAYSGLRIGEVPGVLWEHIGEESIKVVGGEHGTKNRRERMVPIIPAMAGLLARMERSEGHHRVFYLRCVKNALTNACKRVGCEHISHHDLRHLFATVCIESGVDVPTVSRWMGHLDGGGLAMRTYGHLRDHHSKAQSAKVQFTLIPPMKVN